MKKKLLFLLLSLGLNLLSAQNVILSEDFNGGLTNDWYPGFPGTNNITAVENNTTPAADGWVGRIDNDNEGGVGAVLAGPADLSDFYYEAKLFIPLDQATYYGIEFRLDSTGSSSGYNFIIRPVGGFVSPRIRFRYRVGATPTTIRDWLSTEVTGFPSEAGWHKLAVYAKADSFWLYYDDQLLPDSPIIDDKSSAGFVGFYYWDMAVTDTVMLVDDVLVTNDKVTHIKAPEIVKPKIYLAQNYPNPFNPNTTIEFELEKPQHAQLSIYNLNGQLIKRIFNNMAKAGLNRYQWDATDFKGNTVAAGIYMYTLKTANWTESKKMVLIK
jgi:FlgD Ig-like domain